jgi:hypothetical protein
MTPRSHHVDFRGNTHDRRLRRDWLLRTFGNGKTVCCFHCGRRMRTAFEVDRWPLCGHKGGRYVRGNIVPSCRKCNRNHRCRGKRALVFTDNGFIPETL